METEGNNAAMLAALAGHEVLTLTLILTLNESKPRKRKGGRVEGQKVTV